METKAPIPFKLTLAIIPLVYTVYLLSIQYKNHICQEIGTFMQSFLLIHDCEEAIEIKNKGIKYGYIVKCEHHIEIKRKFMLALTWRENIFDMSLMLKLLGIWDGIWQLLNF